MTTPEQRVALDHYCLLGGETVNPRFRHQLDARWSLVLSVNAGYE